MSDYRKLILTTAAAAAGVLAATPASVAGQVAEGEEQPQGIEATDAVLEGASMTLHVDGMVCPFCAYGLEKRLMELSALDETLIQVSDGLVQIRVKDGEQLTDEAVEDAVKRAGFTLREIHRIGG
jgi:mercuric ion binding protein